MNIEEQILKIKQDQIKTLELVERLADSLNKTIDALKKFVDVAVSATRPERQSDEEFEKEWEKKYHK